MEVDTYSLHFTQAKLHSHREEQIQQWTTSNLSDILVKLIDWIN